MAKEVPAWLYLLSEIMEVSGVYVFVRNRLSPREVANRQGRKREIMETKKIKNVYLTDEYIRKHPSLFEQDSPWKASKVIPLVDKFVGHFDKDEMNLLDVGGGAGLVLKVVSSYIEENHGIKVNKFALDLSPGILEIQKNKNPDLKKALNEDICRTSLGNKEIALTLMIDVLEHVPNPIEALHEIKRISDYAIFKVPLEDNLLLRTWNFIMMGAPRRRSIANVGHVNLYNFSKLKHQIEEHAGLILDSYFTNVFDYLRRSKHSEIKMNLPRKLVNLIALYTFKLSPKLSSFLFNDFAMILVKCY
jgi:SAM-dependent methyltransferase